MLIQIDANSTCSKPSLTLLLKSDTLKDYIGEGASVVVKLNCYRYLYILPTLESWQEAGESDLDGSCTVVAGVLVILGADAPWWEGAAS